MIKTVTKRDGSVVEFDVDKINKWGEWSSKECDVSWNDVVFKAVRGVTDGVSTMDLQRALINTCIEYRTEGHTKMAANLLIGDIYKEVFGDFSIPSFKDFYHDMVEEGLWVDMGYTDEELDYLDTEIDHTKDFTYKYCTLRQFVDKYGISVNGELRESPQMAFMGLAAHNAKNDENKLQAAVEAYEIISNLENNLPTPTLALERTPSQVAPSCCVISSEDSVDSIGAATHVAYTMTAKSAGIGIELRTRAPKDPVKNGKLLHGGKHSYYKHIDSAVKSNSQMTRGGSSTVTYNALDPEILDLLTLKQIRTEPTYRIDTMDYSFAFNHLLLRKAAKNEKWMCASPYFAPKLWDLSYSGNQEEFEAEYERVLASNTPKKLINARDIIAAYASARMDNGRVYATFLDNVNSHTPFKDPIRLSNLCQLAA